MHHDKGSAMWMERPLSQQLLCYAANDVHIISLLYHHFQKVGWLSTKAQPDLLEQSARYVTMHANKERLDGTNMFFCHSFLPFNILTECANSAKRCRGCTRVVSQIHFEGRHSPNCRVCQAVIWKKRVKGERDQKKAVARATGSLAK